MTLSLKEISEAMRDIDICMLTTETEADALESRPMSNNRQVDYDGDSWFFAYDSCSAATAIRSKPEVNLSFIHRQVLGKDLYISITGKADLVYDKQTMQDHWSKDVNLWFKDGINTPGIVLIHVKAQKLKYWKGQEQGELTL